MQAVVKNFKLTLDQDAIKAIRFINGLPIDLRVKLNHVNRDMLFTWLQNNALGIFGDDYIPYSQIKATDDDWQKYEIMMNDVISQILGC